MTLFLVKNVLWKLLDYKPLIGKNLLVKTS